jgi:hypothetical protein
MVSVIQALLGGDLDPETRTAFFSARLIALTKRDHGLRPIACGEAFRRIAGKILVQHTRQVASSALLSRHQVAVGVPGGLEAAVHMTRRVMAWWQGSTERGPCSRKVLVKIDLRNAFNLCHRGKLLEGARLLVPDCTTYLRNAYGTATRLHFGDHVIASECGTQQGDPVGGLGFALVLSLARDAMAAGVRDAPDLEVWYSDDGVVGGDISAVAGYLREFDRVSSAHGLERRRDKCVFACDEGLDEEVRAAFGCSTTVRFEDVEVLGSPVGDAGSVDRFASDLAVVAESTFARIAHMPGIHQAATVLAYCGRGVTTHLCRTATPDVAHIRRVDDALVRTAASIYAVPHDAAVVAQLGLKYSQGGFGYRPAAPTARLAFLASCVETREVQEQLAPCLRSRYPLASDPCVAGALSAIVGAYTQLADTIGSYINDGLPHGRSHLQRRWTAVLDSGMLEGRLLAAGAADPSARARLQSCAGSHSSLHPLIDATGAHSPPWLDNAQMAVIARFRLGLPIYESTRPCRMCRGHANCDAHGEHAASCMGGGHRTRLHHGARGDLARLASAALACPRVEVACFPSAPGRRCDVLLQAHSQGGQHCALDYACVHPLLHGRLGDASRTPGGAATAYEAVKRTEYGEPARLAHVAFIPMIQDSFGAWGSSGVVLIRELARRVADRFGWARGPTLHNVRTSLLAAHQRRWATLLLGNAI